MLSNLLFEAFLVKHLIVRGQIAYALVDARSVADDQCRVNRVNLALDNHDLKAFFRRVVLILELSRFDLISDVKVVDSVAQRFHCLNDLADCESGSVKMDRFVLSFEDQLCGVGDVAEDALIASEIDHVFFGLLGSLVDGAILANRVCWHLPSL